MPTRTNDDLFWALVRRALQPETDEEIEAMLDKIGDVPVSEERVRRIVERIRGQRQIGE